VARARWPGCRPRQASSRAPTSPGGGDRCSLFYNQSMLRSPSARQSLKRRWALSVHQAARDRSRPPERSLIGARSTKRTPPAKVLELEAIASARRVLPTPPAPSTSPAERPRASSKRRALSCAPGPINGRARPQTRGAGLDVTLEPPQFASTTARASSASTAAPVNFARPTDQRPSRTGRRVRVFRCHARATPLATNTSRPPASVNRRPRHCAPDRSTAERTADA
jgi:hypothetical protein